MSEGGTYPLEVVLERNPNLTRMDRVRREKRDDGLEMFWTMCAFENAPDQTFRVEADNKLGASIMRAWPMRKRVRARTDAKVERILEPTAEPVVGNGQMEGHPGIPVTALPEELRKAVEELKTDQVTAPMPARAHALLDAMLQGEVIERSYILSTGHPLSDNVRRLGLSLWLSDQRHG